MKRPSELAPDVLLLRSLGDLGPTWYQFDLSKVDCAKPRVADLLTGGWPVTNSRSITIAGQDMVLSRGSYLTVVRQSAANQPGPAVTVVYAVR